ncbi:MAG: TfoX/Sxy family protein [Planctomycetota bacterium]
MHSDAKLVARIDRLAEAFGVERRMMFGGAAWFCGGHFVTGVWHDKLVLRLGPDAAEKAMGRDHVVPMDITGRPMRGWVMVEPLGVNTAAKLRRWIGHAKSFNDTLDPKA